MAATSNHWGDIIKWIETVIESCENGDHIKAAERLINNFETRFESALGHEDMWNIRRVLLIKLNNIQIHHLNIYFF